MTHLIRTGILSLLLTVTACSSTGKTVGEQVDDGVIHSKVKSQLVGFGSSNINIEVYQGLVQLAGFVDTTESREAAVEGYVRVRKPGRIVGGPTDVETDLIRSFPKPDSVLAALVPLVVKLSEKRKK